MLKGPLPRIAVEFIEEQMNSNMAWANIKAMLRLDKETLVRLVGNAGTTEVPIALAINYHCVYYRIQKLLSQPTKLDRDFIASFDKWSLKVTNKDEPINGYWKTKDLSQYKDETFFVAFMFKW